jgi:hypothetical protein
MDHHQIRKREREEKNWLRGVINVEMNRTLSSFKSSLKIHIKFTLFSTYLLFYLIKAKQITLLKKNYSIPQMCAIKIQFQTRSQQELFSSSLTHLGLVGSITFQLKCTLEFFVLKYFFT